MLLDELENNIFSNEETGARTVPLGNWESPTIGRNSSFLFLFFVFKKKKIEMQRRRRTSAHNVLISYVYILLVCLLAVPGNDCKVIHKTSQSSHTHVLQCSPVSCDATLRLLPPRTISRPKEKIYKRRRRNI